VRCFWTNQLAYANAFTDASSGNAALSSYTLAKVEKTTAAKLTADALGSGGTAGSNRMATVRINRGRWVADYRDQHGRRRIETPKGPFENRTQEKSAAHALLARRVLEVARGDYQPHGARLTFSQVCTRYLESKVNIRSSTRRGYESLITLYLDPYFGSWKVHEIATSDIERFRSELSVRLPPPVAEAFAQRQGRAKSSLSEARAKQHAGRDKPGARTVNKCLTLLTMILNYATRHRWVDRNAAEHVEKLRDMNAQKRIIDTNVFTPAEIRLLLDNAQAARRDRHGALITTNYRLILKVAIFTGVRSGELLGLQWGDLDWPSRQLHVRRSWKDGAYHAPKTAASSRRVDLPEFLMSELREWRLACPKGDDDLVFPNLEGRPLSHANLLQRGFYPALRRAGLRQIRFHDLRHTFASLLLANGEDIVRVSRLLGHASPTITLSVYSHMLPREHYGSTDRLASLIYGNKVETSHQAAISARPDAEEKSLTPSALKMVARGRIELPTRGFSVRCSTN